MRHWMAVTVPVALLAIVTVASAEDQPVAPTTLSPAKLKFATPPGLPACVKAGTLKGDPANGASLILAKVTAGCRVPWHWHTATEHLMIVSGTGTVEMKDAKPFRMESGAYAALPGHHVHRVTCASACTFFVASDGTFDIHYVDDAGNEIPPEQALKPVPKRRPR